MSQLNQFDEPTRDRRNVLLAMPEAERLAARLPKEQWMDLFCTDCGAEMRNSASGTLRCPPCAVAAGDYCSECGQDAGNGCGGYSNCCGAPVGAVLN